MILALALVTQRDLISAALWLTLVFVDMEIQMQTVTSSKKAYFLGSLQ
jgi:hypothetical protein